AASSTLVTVDAEKFFLLGPHVSKTRNVNAVRSVAERQFVFVTRHFAASARAHVMIHGNVAEVAAGIGKAVGKFGRSGIEKDTGGLQRGSAKEKHARLEFERALGLRIDHANTADTAGFWIEDEAVDNAVRANGEAPGFLRGGKRGTETAEIGRGDAAAMANAAIVAGSAPFVSPSKHGRAADGHHAIIKMFGERVAKIPLDTGHFHRRQKFSVGQLRQAFGLAADAGELFHIVIPGCDVRIADRPIDRDSLLQIRFKVEIAPAIALAPPSERFSAHLAA